MDAKYNGALAATTAYVGWYYFCTLMQGTIRTAKAIPASDSYRYFLDRNFGNNLEQGFAFLSGLWIHALFLSPEDAGTLGLVYVATRVMYTLIWITSGSSMKPPGTIALATMPGYFIILYFYVSSTLSRGIPVGPLNIKESVGGMLPLAVVAAGLPAFFVIFLSALTMNKMFVGTFADPIKKA